MDTATQPLVGELTLAAEEARIVFPEVVRQLATAGVERYHADLVIGQRTFYLAMSQLQVGNYTEVSPSPGA